jgi:hypothetical protein
MPHVADAARLWEVSEALTGMNFREAAYNPIVER